MQIGPRLTSATKELLDQACQARMVSVSEVVEHALLAYLAPTAEAEQTPGIAQTLATLQARVDDMHTALGIVITLLTPKAPEKNPEPERPKIATYTEMYGAIEPPPAAPPVPEPVVLMRGPLRRWLTREAP
jgi:hypothetical protein